MRKALHEENDEFFTLREGKFAKFCADDIDWLLAAANDAPNLEYKDKQGLTLLFRNGVPVTTLSPEDSFCCWVNRYMNILVNEDVTEDLVDELNTALTNIRYIHILMISKSKSSYWQNNVADMNRASTPDEAAAYSFAHQLTIGGLDGLKRCELSGCRKFFVGRSNAKWCSKSCGGKHRVRKKRKRDLE